MSCPPSSRVASRRIPTLLWDPHSKVSLFYGKRTILKSRRRAESGPAVTGARAVGPWPSIPAMVDSTATHFADLVAVRDGSTSLTYAELSESAREFGAALVAAGVAPRDRVAIWCGNCAEWTVAALGVFAAGGVLVPVNTRFKGAEAALVLSRSGARVLVTVTDFLGTDYVAMLEDTGTPLTALRTIVIAKGDLDGSAQSWQDFTARAAPGTR